MFDATVRRDVKHLLRSDQISFQAVKILLIHYRYPSKSRPFVATYIQSIYNLIRPMADVQLFVGTLNARGRFMKIFEFVWFNFRVLISPKISKAEVLYVHHLNSIWQSIRKKVRPHQKIILHWHGSEIRYSRRFHYIDVWKNEALIANAIHIAPSEFFKQMILKKLTNVTEVNVIPSGGIDMDLLKPSDFSVSDDQIVIGFAGHLTEAKGVDFLIELAKQKEDLSSSLGKNVVLKCLAYGMKDKSTPEHLERLQVDVLSPISKRNMAQFYNQTHIIIFPTRNESLGLVPLEAMACGVPVICPNDFACPEYCIPGKTGELYEPDNIEDFMDKVRLVAGRLKSYDTVPLIRENYSIDSVKESYRRLFELVEKVEPAV